MDHGSFPGNFQKFLWKFSGKLPEVPGEVSTSFDN
jgi:hypothetical protein